MSKGEAMIDNKDIDLIRQGAEAAARCKMFMYGIDRKDLISHYNILDSRLTSLADKLEKLETKKDNNLNLNRGEDGI